MKLTIIPSDGAIYKDGYSYSGLELPNIPSNVHALQWDTTSGWVEYNDGAINLEITDLPEWAITAVDIWESKKANDVIEQPQEIVLSYDQKLALIRAERNRRISLTDWTQAGDVVKAHSYDWNQSWESYRQALRDLPNNITEDTVETFTYPIPPEL